MGMKITIVSENDPELRGGLTVKDIKGEFASPCMTCKRRALRCHADCEPYLRWKLRRDWIRSRETAMRSRFWITARRGKRVKHY